MYTLPFISHPHAMIHKGREEFGAVVMEWAHRLPVILPPDGVNHVSVRACRVCVCSHEILYERIV
jgi:hypothetical protein